MTTAWMVTRGCYSDYEVSAVFTDEAKAIMYAAGLNVLRKSADAGRGLVLDDGAHRVEVVELNPESEHAYRGNPPWYVAIQRRDAAVVAVGPEPCPRPSGAGSRHLIECLVYARDEAHAVKVASEMRATWIAAGR